MTPAPYIDPHTWDRISDANPEGAQQVENDDRAIHSLAQVTKVSRSLTRLLISDNLALEALLQPDVRAALPTDAAHLPAWCRREVLRIAGGDLSGDNTLPDVGAALARLADDCVAMALAFTDGTDGLAVVGMGKLGGNELNYSSDIDLMLVGECSERATRTMLSRVRECFRVDLNLRPEGQSGTLVRSVPSFQQYWERWASPWEFQALLKARVIAGNSEVGALWAEKANDALWSRPFGADELRELSDMKSRSESLVDAKSEVKRGVGGIRDVEFAVQKLQLVHGGADSAIRSPNTLDALRQLTDGDYIDSRDARIMADAYVFLRTVEHRLQLVEQQQTHTVPAADVERGVIATGLDMSLETFDERLLQCRTDVRHAYQRLYFRPLLESFAGHGRLSEASVRARANALGFFDTKRTKEAIDELTKGLTRSSSLMRQLMPLIVQWLSDSPDPDEGLMGLRKMINGFRTPAKAVSAFRDSPEVARRLCLLLGTSKTFPGGFLRHPELFDAIDNPQLVGTHDDIRSRLRTTLEWRTSGSDTAAILMRFDEGERMRISMADVLELEPDRSANRSRTALADAVLQESLHHLAPGVPVALIAMGRYGGNELSPASDLDLIVVYDGQDASDQAEALRVAKQLKELVGSASPGRRMYSVDYDLRPEGKQGPIARSIEGCVRYYKEWASTWERQALVRARFAAGDEALGMRFLEIVDSFTWTSAVSKGELRDIRQLKARMETERMPRNEDPRYHLKLGPGSLSDVEWTIQLLQLQHGVKGSETVLALPELRRAGLLEEADAFALEDAWEFCQRVRNRASLIEGRLVDALPLQPHKLGVLARSLQTNAAELRESYLKTTRRSRKSVERLFYGKVAL